MLNSIMCKTRRLLDFIYLASGILSALFLLALLLIIVAAMLTRFLGIGFPGATDYAGYMMAGASFLAFAYTLNKGGHVRVSLLLGRLTGRARYVGELICHILASILSTVIAWHAINMVYWSYLLGDVSQGQDASKLWVVQSPVAIGAVILAICFIDNLLTMLVRKRDNIIAEIVE